MNGGSSLTHELKLLAASYWGFDLTSIIQQVDIWVGKEDHLTPPPMSEKLCTLLTNNKCTVHIVENEGHYSIYAHHFVEILKSVLIT